MNPLHGLIIVVGNYGSGKTEIVINLALYHQQLGIAVRVADLDLVNPYFRTRNARTLLADRQIEMILPPEHLLDADLPVLTRSVGGLIGDPDPLTLLDVGGNDVGARVLSALGDHLVDRPSQLLLVINPMRPTTDTVAGCLDMRSRIEAAANLTVTGLIGNAHLMEHTTVNHIYEGELFCQAVAEAAALPLLFVTVPVALAGELEPEQFTSPVLHLDRQLTMPWFGSSEPG